MRFVIIGNHGKSMNETSDEVHLTNILRQFGHEVFDYNAYDLELLLSGNGWTNAYGRKFQPCPNNVDSLILFKSFADAYNLLDPLKKLTEAKKVVYWNPDLMENCGNEPRNPTNPAGTHAELAKRVDIYLSKELGWKRQYEDFGANFVYFPTNLAPSYIYNRNWLRNDDKHFLYLSGITEDTYPVVFTGTFTDIGENRPVFLKQLDDKIDNLHIFSYNSDCWQERGFKNVHGGIWDDSYKYLICRSKLNIALDWRTDVEGYWSDRINQIQACGGVVLAKYVKGMEREFGPDGEAIIYWSKLSDLLEKIEYWLEHEEYRAQVGQKAFELSQGYHVAERRVMELLTILENVR